MIYQNPKNARLSSGIGRTISLLICISISIHTYAQTTVTLGGEGTITCPATSSATWSTPPAGVTFSNLTRGPGVTCVSAGDGINGSGYNTASAAASYAAGKYYTVTITADATHTFTLSAITWLTTVSSGSAQFTIQYSNNGGALTTFGAAAQTSGSSNAFSGSVTVAAGTSIVIYAIPNSTGASGTTVRFKNNSTFVITASTAATCTTPNSLAFTSVPSTTAEDALMNVSVSARCSSSGLTATTLNSGSVTLTTSGCGLAGTRTASFVNGVATFSNIYFSRSTQTATLTTSNTGSGYTLSNVTSGAITVTVPVGGTSTQTTIASENFEGSTQWANTVSTPIYTGSGGTANGNYMAVKSFTVPTNKAFVKSYTALNGSGDIESQCTATFINKLISSSYSSCTFSFQVGSLSNGGSGDGNDTGEDMFIETSTDNGLSWSRLLTYKGYSNYLLPLSASSPVALTIGGNATYSGNAGATQSAFTLTLPAGTTQFMFRMTATNNRSEENWAIDNITLVGTTLSGGVRCPLPMTSVAHVDECPLADATLAAVTSNAVGALTYTWAPTTYFKAGSTASSATPTVSFAAGSQTYTVTVRDADGCTATAGNSVSITPPTGTAVLAPASITLEELQCPDANGWTYYADPSDLTRWEFAIYKNGNDFTASVNVNVKTIANTAYDIRQDASQGKAVLSMGRYWNAVVSTGSIAPSRPIKVRFFYDRADSTEMTAGAQAFATAHGGTLHAMEWFKTTTGITYLPINNTVSDVPSRLTASAFTTTRGVLGSIPYIEYAGLTGFSGGTAAIRVSRYGVALPVELLYLTAAPVDNSYIRLDWATASEVSNLKFDIERSIDGDSFEVIGEMTGHHTSNTTITYHTDDRQAAAGSVYYYRLRQWDVDGRYEYSNMVSARLTGEAGFTMHELKPNPASGLVTINVSADDMQSLYIALTDVLGRQLRRQSWDISPGLNGTQLAVDDLPVGVYYVTVRSSRGAYTRVLSVIK